MSVLVVANACNFLPRNAVLGRPNIGYTADIYRCQPAPYSILVLLLDLPKVRP